MRILVINPGNTSTKLALYDGPQECKSVKLEHSRQELAPYAQIYDQLDFRMGLVRRFLDETGIRPEELSAVVSRGGLVRPIPCGTYRINDQMLEDLRRGVEGHHASNLGPALACGVAEPAGIPAYIVDPITVDELDPVARLTGLPELPRQSRLHTLNHKAVARKAAAALGGKYEDFNFVVCHLGTGTSVAAHRHGRVVDMCDARGEGPMSGDRCGGVNAYLALASVRNGGAEALMGRMTRGGGLAAHLGTGDLREIKRRIAGGDEHAALVLRALIYQCAKEIGAQSAALSGRVDRIILTGGMANDGELMKELSAMVEFIAPVVVIPGEEEMEALALGALRVLTGEEIAREYAPD